MLSAADRKLYKEMYGFPYDEQARAPSYGGVYCACQKTKATGQPCKVSPTQYVGVLLVCDYHITWAKKTLHKMARDF